MSARHPKAAEPLSAVRDGVVAGTAGTAAMPYIQRALDELGYEPAGEDVAALTPEHVNPLGTYDFSSDRPAGQLRPLRTATAA